MLRPGIRVVAMIMLWSGVVSTAQGQSSVILNGRAVDSAGVGVKVDIVVRTAAQTGTELSRGTSDSGGSFHVTLAALPARIAVDALVSGGLAARTELDSAIVRASRERPVVIHVRAVQHLAVVKVKGRYQKRPSIYNFMEAEPSTRTESINPITTDWFDPLAAGNMADILRASPDMLIGADGGASLMGAPSSDNQLEIGGMQVPSGLVTGVNGGSVTASQWDVTAGGATGATVNISMGPPRPNHSTLVTLRSGIDGMPSWIGAAGQPRGTDIPLQVSAISSGPVGKFGYSGTAFFQRDNSSLPRWDRTLGADAHGVLDSISDVLGAHLLDANARSVSGGVMGRFDFVPYGGKRVLGLTSALTRSEQTGGPGGDLRTASLGSSAVHDVGLLQLESKNVLRERVLWTSQLGVSISSDNSTRFAAAPTIIATDPDGGNTIMTGGAAQQPSSRVVGAEARSTAAWYSRDNKTRYVAQLQARGQRARLGSTDSHSTFMAASLEALQRGQAISLTRENGMNAASASSFVLAPALGARHDLGKNGSLTLGVRADAWTTRGVATSGTMQHLDVSPRVSLYQRIGKRSADRGPLASLRVGAGRFTTWPDVQQWANAWAGGGATREVCSGLDVPSISLDIEAPSCIDGGTIQAIGRTVAYGDLRPSASNRADASLTFGEIAPGVMAQFGAALAQNNRIAASLSPLADSPIKGSLAGDGNRALLVSESAIGASGVIAVAAVPSGVPDVMQLVSAASNVATQWRIKFATSNPFARLKWDATYVLTTGHERTLAIASPMSAPSFISGPLSAGGKHAFAFSLGTWIGEANIRIAGLLRSGVRFTPLADRDLNGDGRANDAAFVPQAMSDSWANTVSPTVRDCVRAAAGHIAGLNSCTGPWSITSLISGSVPGMLFGLPRGSSIFLQLSNPLAAFAGTDRFTFGNVAAVNSTLTHITGFDAASHSFNAQPLSGFGKPLGLSSGVADPMRLVIGVQMPIGPSVVSQRMDKTLTKLQRDTSTQARNAAGMQYLGDIPPVPLGILQTADAIQLTGEQRQELQVLGKRWTATASRLVLDAYGSGPTGDAGSAAALRVRMVNARDEFFIETGEINREVRNLLTPDQIDLLPSGFRMMLDPRFWKYVSLYDAGDF